MTCSMIHTANGKKVLTMRPIDADALFRPNDVTNKILIITGKSGGKTIALATKLMEARVNAAPTLTLDDLIPHGRWIPTGTNNAIGPLVRCSSCGKYINPSATAIELNRQKLEPKFCENCGAKMDKEE